MVSGAVFLFANDRPILNAAAAASGNGTSSVLYFPPPFNGSASQTYITQGVLNFSAYHNLHLRFGTYINAADTWDFGNADNDPVIIEGDAGGFPLNQTQFGWVPTVGIISTGDPAIHSSGPALFWAAVSNPSDNGMLLEVDGTGDIFWTASYAALLSGSGDGLDNYGVLVFDSAAIAKAMNRVLFSTSNTATPGFPTTTPAIFLYNGGDFQCDACSFVGRGIGSFSNIANGAEFIHITGGYEQAGVQPIVTFGACCGAGNLVGSIKLDGFGDDTGNTEVIANWAGINKTAILADTQISNGGLSVITGNAFDSYVVLGKVCCSTFGQTFNRQTFTNSVLLVTTAATTDTAFISGVSSASICTAFPSNAAAATNIATTYVSNVTTNNVTLTHTATANMDYNIVCTLY